MLHAKTSRMICDSNLVSSLRLKRGIQAKKSTTNGRRNTLFPRPRPLAGFGNKGLQLGTIDFRGPYK